MIEIYDFSKGSAVDLPAEPLSLALGSFDGVHLGHRALLDEAVESASALGLAGAAMTFDRNPSGAPTLTSLDEKLALFEAAGLKYAVICRFDRLRELEAEDFVRKVLIERLGARLTVCGFNHRFGKAGGGDPALLERIMRESGGDCRTLPAVLFEGEPVSSSRIRAALSKGDIESASAMLGRPYSICGEVVHGRALGRTLGFPTVNQRLDPERALPARGVYACRCLDRPAVCNIGVRPTVDDSQELLCETHIVGFEGDLYGSPLRVTLLRFLRPEMRFDSLDALRAQLALDIEALNRL